MIANRMTRQMIDLQKSTLDMMLHTMSGVQEQSGRAAQAWFEQMAGLPQEGVKTMRRWMDTIGDTRNEMNSVIREGFVNWENMVEQTMRQTENIAREGQRSVQQQWKPEQPAGRKAEARKSQPASEDDLQNLKEQLEERNP